MSTSRVDNDTLAVSKKTITRHAKSPRAWPACARHQHDLLQGMMYTDEAVQADSILDTIERYSER